MNKAAPSLDGPNDDAFVDNQASMDQQNNVDPSGGVAQIAPSSAAIADSTDEDSPQCPDCGSTTPWGMSSWCPECGYYPAIADRAFNEVEEVVEVDEDAAQQPKQWSFLQKLNVGIFTLCVFTMVIRTLYFYMDADRGLWTLIQSVAGISTAAIAQAMTAIYAAKDNDRYSLWSAIINPLDIWVSSVENNVYQNRLCAVIWGITAAVLAFALIGGLTEDHFFKAFERNKASFNVAEEIGKVTEAITGEENLDGDSTLGVATGDVAADELDPAEQQHILSCTIYGFMTSGGEKITRVLLAAERDGEMQHVGILSAKALGKKKTAALTNILKSLQMPSTEVKTSFVAKWVDPSFTIAVEHDGFDSFGSLINTRLPEEKEEEGKRKKGDRKRDKKVRNKKARDSK